MKKKAKRRMTTKQFKKKIQKLTGQKYPPIVTKLKKPKINFDKQVYIMAFEPAGMQHFPRVGQELLVQERILLVPVDNNAHDPFAIVISRAQGGDIGWFPRIDPEDNYHTRRAGTLQQALHRAIKGGVGYYACITSYQRGQPPTISLYLEKP